jgi:hypothetical protein
MEDKMVDFLALGGVLSLPGLAQQQTAGTRDIKALSYVAANDSGPGYRPILARHNTAYAVAFSLDRQDPAYALAFSAI